MAGMETVINTLESRFAKEIRAHQLMPAEEGNFAPFPEGVHPKLAEVIEAQGIGSLYSHQAEETIRVFCHGISHDLRRHMIATG